MHYVRWRRHGTTDRHIPTPEERFWAKVEKGDGCWKWSGQLNVLGYGVIGVDGRTTQAHRFSYTLAKGPIPEGMLVDHMCHTPACVNPDHLRLATSKQNNENRAGADKRSQSGIRGVKLEKSGRWSVRVGHNGKLRRYGMFDTKAEAEAVAVMVRNALFTHNIEKDVA